MRFKIKSCVNCGSFLFINSCLCEPCYGVVIRKFSYDRISLILGKRVRALLKWNPGESDSLSRVIHHLKKDQLMLWEKLSLEFIRKNQIHPNPDMILVSLESTLSSHTHAQDWGQCLAKHLACEHVVMLKKLSTDAQKKKSKNERYRVELMPIVDISHLVHKKVIFVDDIVTTGSTLKAAYEALGSPRDFECWSMAVRTVGSIAD